MFIKFPSIESFGNVMKFKEWQKESRPETYKAEFSLRPKVKLHGTNLGLGTRDGEVWIQSRNGKIEDGDSFMQAETLLRDVGPLVHEAGKRICAPGETLVIFGEWAGNGIQNKDAVTLIGKKMFFPFLLAKAPAELPEDINEARSLISVIADPAEIRRTLGFEHPMIMILPWAGEERRFSTDDVDFTASVIEEINEDVDRIAVADPFIREAFGVVGPGEGLVFVPSGPTNLLEYSNLSFKAKTEAHRVKKSAKAASVKVEVPESAHAFVEDFVTENRMEQMLSERIGGELDKARTGDFVRSVIEDVMKESAAERAEMGVDDKVLTGLISKRAAKWFVDRCENSWAPSP